MKRFLPLLIILLALQGFSQQDPLFSQYMFNKLSVNPAYAGSREAITTDIIYRYQWVSIPGSPKTISASVHAPLNNPHIGLGLTAYNDVLGASRYQGAVGNFAYRILFPKSKLAFGLQFGVLHTDIDWNKVHPRDIEDPFYNAQLKNKVAPDANFGIYYYSNKYFLGFSSKHLFQNQVGTIVVNGNEEFSKLLRHFYGMAGAALPIAEGFIFRPSMLVKYVQNAPPQMDLNMSLLISNTFWFGVSYRTERALSFMTEFNAGPRLRIGYSYDVWMNQLKAYNKGSHEIRLGFDIDMNKSRMMSPRYF